MEHNIFYGLLKQEGLPKVKLTYPGMISELSSRGLLVEETWIEIRNTSINFLDRYSIESSDSLLEYQKIKALSPALIGFHEKVAEYTATKAI